jgi:hypothetical protein
MIPITAHLRAEWVDPVLLLMDHQAHGIGIDGDHVLALVARLRADPEQSTDPIVVARRAGRLWVENGRHRVLAHLLAGRAQISAVIVEG